MLRGAWAALWPVTLLWVGLVAFAFWQDAAWPSAPLRRLSFAALAVVVFFLVLVATLMLRKMQGWYWQTVVLAVAFGAVSAMPFYLMGIMLWRSFFREHNTILIIGTCAVLIVPLFIASVVLAVMPFDGHAREQRAEGVIEGHAQGVADEQAAQHVRDGAAHGE
jgi:hypothetical protein